MERNPRSQLDGVGGLLCHPGDSERARLVLRALEHTPQRHVSVPSGQTLGLLLGVT